MNPETRQQIRENAQYLRSVRPLDPDEIHEYVESQPHPAVVRQVLREESFDLAIVEQDDGTFVPAPDGPLSVPFHGVERFPDEHERGVEDLLVEAYGPEWHSGDSGDRLRERIRDVKERYLVEPSAAADVLETMLDHTGQNVQWDVHRETAEAFDPEGEYDLILFSNVLSELDDPAAVVRRYLGSLAEDGTVVAMAPADRNTALELREVERAVADDGPATVYAPTVRLWPHQSPTSESWSFDRKPDIEVPTFQKQLDDAAGGMGEFVNVDVQYAYSVLRTDGQKAIEMTPDRSTHAPMADAEQFVTDRVNLLAVKLSHDLSERDGANPLFLVGDGSQSVDHFAVLTDESALNVDLRRADYGDLLSLQNVLVLWNDDEAAYNVVVDGEAVVDRAR